LSTNNNQPEKNLLLSSNLTTEAPSTTVNTKVLASTQHHLSIAQRRERERDRDKERERQRES
jgi:hypothetical protein